MEINSLKIRKQCKIHNVYSLSLAGARFIDITIIYLYSWQKMLQKKICNEFFL